VWLPCPLFTRESASSPQAGRAIRSNTFCRTRCAELIDQYAQFATFRAANGPYDVTLVHERATDRGLVELSFDGGAVKSTVDMYIGGTNNNVLHTFQTTFARSGVHTMRLKTNGKNAASSNFFTVWNCAFLKRAPTT
jgi:hypothetical protein